MYVSVGSAVVPLADVDHAVPFQCMTSGWMVYLSGSVHPTAHASVTLLALTAVSQVVLEGAVTASCDHAVPFQLSMTGFAPRPLGAAFEMPTAQASVADTSLTPASDAFSPVGGAETIVQPLDAKAGPAPRTSAAPSVAIAVDIRL
jgi:hypothetical protein